MQRITVLFAFLFCTQLVFSQVWFEAGGKAMYGLTGFYNENLVNANNYNYQLNTAFSYGGVFSMNFGEKHGVNLEGLLATHQQSFELLENGSATRLGVEWQATDFYLMYRFYTESGAFFELGPKLTSVRKVEQSEGQERMRADDNYEDSYYSGALGFGGFLAGTEFFTVKLGVRLEYGLSDFISDQGQKDGYPAPGSSLDPYTPSHPFRAAIALGINFRLGGIAKSMWS